MSSTLFFVFFKKIVLFKEAKVKVQNKKKPFVSLF